MFSLLCLQVCAKGRLVQIGAECGHHTQRLLCMTVVPPPPEAYDSLTKDVLLADHTEESISRADHRSRCNHCLHDEKAPAADGSRGPPVWCGGASSAPFRVHVVADQNAPAFRRPPVTVMPLSEAVGMALLRMALRICAADEPGFDAA